MQATDIEAKYYIIRAYTQRTPNSKLKDITPTLVSHNIFYDTEQGMRGMAVGLLFGLMLKHTHPIIIVHQCDRLGNHHSLWWKTNKNEWRDYQD